MFSFDHATSSSGVTEASELRITNALTSSPWVGWGTPMTAASEIAGWVSSTSSISRG